MTNAFRRLFGRLVVPAPLVAACCLTGSEARAQLVRNGAVGGVKVDVDGVISSPTPGDFRELQAAWQAGLNPVPADLDKPVELRFVSLRNLEAEAAKATEAGKAMPDSVRCLAGLTRIRYVLVYPEQKDLVLAGPAEGWRVNERGSVVGKTSGRPTLLLDDLLVALRVAETSRMSGISCSIDPKQENLQRMQQVSDALSRTNGMNPEVAGRQLEQAAGSQDITVTGVPATSHFGRVLVAADFRMKRLAMDFEPAPVSGMPSYLDLVASSRRATNNMMPRWWLASDYEPIHRDEAGLVWELRGQGVKCMNEAQMNAGDQIVRAGKPDPTAQKWADNFTKKFSQLAQAETCFGELRNVMDLSVVTALVAKERLLERSGLEIPRLRQDTPLEEFSAPRSVQSLSSFTKAGSNTIVTVSGGVQIFPWQVAEKVEVSKDLAKARPDKPADKSTGWYWQK